MRRSRTIGRNTDIMGNGRGQRPLKHKISILDEDNNAIEKRNVEEAIGGATSQKRVVATARVVRPEAIKEIMEKSPYSDSRELARTKLKGLGEL